MTDVPHENRPAGTGRLKYGNPPGDLRTAKRCGAKNRRGLPCRCPAMRNGRCRLHGGLSTGARTPEGRAKCAMSNYRHGRYTYEAIRMRREAAQARRDTLALIRRMRELEGWT